MGLAIVHSRARVGVRAPEVRVEVHLAGGLPAMSIVGLPEAAVREAKDRVRAAILCAQWNTDAAQSVKDIAVACRRALGFNGGPVLQRIFLTAPRCKRRWRRKGDRAKLGALPEDHHDRPEPHRRPCPPPQ